MKDPNGQHPLVTSPAGLKSLRDRLEGTSASFSGHSVRRPHRASVLVLDASGSMAGSEAEVRRGACSFAREALQTSAVGVIRFGCSVSVDVAPSRVNDDVLGACNSYRANLGGTVLVPALETGERLLGAHRVRTIVLVSDGTPADSSRSIALARELRDKGVRIVAIGTTGADAAFLASIAGDPSRSKLVTRGQLASAISDVTRLLHT